LRCKGLKNKWVKKRKKVAQLSFFPSLADIQEVRPLFG